MTTKQKDRVYGTVPPRVKKLLVRDADIALRSLGAQVEYIITKYYEDRGEITPRLSHSQTSQQKVQN